MIVKAAEVRRCLGGKNGAIYTIESAAGRAPKGIHSVVCRYKEPSAKADIVYLTKERLHDALWLSPDDDVYTVDSKGHVHASHGGAWTRSRVSKHALHALSGLDDGQLIAGGEGGAAGLFGLDGAKWAPLADGRGLDSLEPSASILQIAGSARSDFYVVARDPFEVPRKCSLIRFDGSAWTPLELRAISGPKVRQIAKLGIPSAVSSVYCATADDVFLCGAGGLLMKGNPRSGWKKLGDLRRTQKAYSMGMIGSTLYFAWTEGARRGFGIMAWNGKTLRSVRDDILPWHLTSRHDRLYVTWANGFGTYDGRRWDIHGRPDVAR